MLRTTFGAVLLCCLLAIAQAAIADEIRGARFPALSPDGSTLVFEYWGDLWRMPADGSAPAQRITDHLAWDWYPRFSPDGSEIAFISDRSGNQDVWVIPAAGGPARQITTFSDEDYLCDWSNDGTRLIFYSQRGLWAYDLYTVDAQGQKPPWQITSNDHYLSIEAVELPDGSLVYGRGSARWWRKGYRGTAEFELWRLGADGTYQRLTEFAGRDRWPMPAADGRSVYYVCNEDGIDNIWQLDLAGGARQQLTSFDSDGVQWPSIAPGTDTMVFEQDGWLYRLAAGAGAPEKLTVTLDAEAKDNFVVRQSFNDEAGEYAVSPHGRYVVVEYAGDLWAVKDPEAFEDDEKPDQDLAQAWRLTASDGARERQPAFAPDNRRLAYVSDADGDYEVYVLDLADMSVRQVTDNTVDDMHPVFDPAGADYLFYYSGNSSIVRCNLETAEVNTVAEGRFRGDFDYYGFSVSPDGAWVSFVKELGDWSAEIYIVDSAGENEPVNITRDPGWEGDPRWSADGRRLVFRGQARGTREYDTAIYVVDLDPEPDVYDVTFLFEDDLEDADAVDGDSAENGDEDDDVTSGHEDDDDDENGEDDDDENGEDDDSGDGAGRKAKEVKVTIDFEDIHLRAREVSSQEGARRALLSDDGEWVVYSCDPDGEGREIWAVKAEGGEAAKLLDGDWDSPQFAARGRRLYFRDGGTVQYLKFSKGKSKGQEAIHARGEFWLDRRARWLQMFTEGWRALGQRFYDPAMHGTDWQADYRKYLPYIESLGTPEEFGLVFQELLGELNASHLAIYMSESSFTGEGKVTAHLGLEFDPEFAGPGLQVSHVTYRGPADQPGIDIATGDVVLAIDGQPVDKSMRWLELLDGKAGRPVVLQVQGAQGQDSRDVALKPIAYGAYQNLLYREWEIANEQRVAELSGGRIGYIHIRGMSRRELRKFEREFFSEFFDKDALIVDVRFNPGGWIHEDLFSLLDRNPFAFASHRDSPRTMQPARAFNKPKALLINARSGSDAEIFPSGWRTLGLGPIIGIDTAGAVIGTGGFTLVDGTWVRLPLEGWWDLNGRNLEQSGTPPDIYIDVDPAELRAGRDAQLDKAVEVLLAELDDPTTTGGGD